MYFTPGPKPPSYNDYQYGPSSVNNQTHNDVSTSGAKKFHYANTPQKNKYEYGMFSRRFVPGNGNKTNLSAYGANHLNKSSRMMSQNNSSINIGGVLLNTEQLFSEEMIFLLSD